MHCSNCGAPLNSASTLGGVCAYCGSLVFVPRSKKGRKAATGSLSYDAVADELLIKRLEVRLAELETIVTTNSYAHAAALKKHSESKVGLLLIGGISLLVCLFCLALTCYIVSFIAGLLCVMCAGAMFEPKPEPLDHTTVYNEIAEVTLRIDQAYERLRIAEKERTLRM